jgi:Ca2+-binding RTX toxin-like protein
MRRFITATAVTTVAALPFMWSVPSQAAVPTCFGKPATIVGTAGPDSLEGGPNDVVYGGGGDDGISGAPIMCGGSGADSIDGTYKGDDKIRGGGGADNIEGEFGVDTLLGGGGDDRIEDTDDFDWSDEHDPGTDIMRGGPGDDTINSTSGSDKVYGNSGQDTLTDYTRVKSYLYGGRDNDVIDATNDNLGTNPFVPDYVSGDLGYDIAFVHYDDIVSSSTESRVNQ